MLKDVSDSHRLNVRFYEEEGAVLAESVSHVTNIYHTLLKFLVVQGCYDGCW